jgi:hypothetical protein
MALVNHYHGCEIASSDDVQRHALRRCGETIGEFGTLAEAIQAARRLNDESLAGLLPAVSEDAVPPRCFNDPELPATD